MPRPETPPDDEFAGAIEEAEWMQGPAAMSERWIKGRQRLARGLSAGQFTQLQLDLGDRRLADYEPWELTREQFTKQPTTFFTARGEENLGETGYSMAFDGLSGGTLYSGGLHVGEKKAALERGKEVVQMVSNPNRQKAFPKDPQRPVRLFSVRPQGRFSNMPPPELQDIGLPEGRKDWPTGEDLGTYWPTRKQGHYYYNQIEGVEFTPGEEGSQHLGTGRYPLSIQVPVEGGSKGGSVEKHLLTHKKAVLQRQATKGDVLPHILQEAQMLPEWDATFDPPKAIPPINSRNFGTDPQGRKHDPTDGDPGSGTYQLNIFDEQKMEAEIELEEYLKAGGKLTARIRTPDGYVD